jgi:AraC family transcriptional regulator of adaptative response / DNA-3-methyladenine glycosylase II
VPPVALGLDRRALDRARVSRDPRFDGRFFIAVVTTRIYCRPICPVPSPRPANVRYYATAAAAAEAGFRPCLRCRPEAAPGTPAWLGTSAVVQRALRLIDEGAIDAAGVPALAARLGIGARHLHRLFHEHVGASPVTVAQTRRLHFAKRLLDETALSVTELAAAAGYRSVRRFNEAFRGAYGRAPRDVRRRRRAGVAEGPAGEVVLELAYRPPYDWPLVVDFLRARAIPGVERADGGSYTRVVSTTAGPAAVRISSAARRHAVELRVLGASSAALRDLAGVARRVFDLACDPGQVNAALRRDPVLGALVAARPGLRIPGAWDPFECAVRAVLGQQVSVAAGLTLVGRVVERCGRPLPAPHPWGLTHTFPGAADVAVADLAGLGLTGARRRTLRALAVAVADGAIDFQAAADDLVAALQAVPGIGDWTAQYVALRALGSPDAFPAGDLVLRRAAAGGTSTLAERELRARAEAWRPWRAYAALHLWHAHVPRRTR